MSGLILDMRSKKCFTFVLIPAPVTPNSIRGRYDGDDAQPPALIPKLIDNLEPLFRAIGGRQSAIITITGSRVRTKSNSKMIPAERQSAPARTQTKCDLQ